MAEGQIETWRKKGQPNITVEAVRLNEENAAMVAAWCGGEVIEEINPEHPDEKQPGINITTPKGVKRASLHMYVINFARAFFVQNNRPFEMLYEPANRPETPLESAGDTRKRLGFGDAGGPVTI